MPHIHIRVTLGDILFAIAAVFVALLFIFFWIWNWWDARKRRRNKK